MHQDTIKITDTIYAKMSNFPAAKSFENYLVNPREWWVHYSLYVLLITILLRVLFSLMRANEEKFRDVTTDGKSLELFALENAYKGKKFVERWKIIFHGCSNEDPNPDLWYNTFIGTFELFAFPFIFKSEQYAFIGAWLGYKVVANWSVWNKNRLKFNSFLIGNLIVLIVSYILKLMFF